MEPDPGWAASPVHAAVDTVGTGERWFCVGRSADDDPAVAARQAVLGALGHAPARVSAWTPATRRSGIDVDSTRLLMVFCSPPPGMDIRDLLAAVQEVTPPQAGVVGCTTSGQLAGPGLGLDGSDVRRGVVAIALGGDGFQVRTQVVRDASRGRREAGIAAAGCVAELDRPHQICLLICDGLTREQHEIVRGAYSVLGATVPVAGGCSGDDYRYERTYQFHGDARGIEALTDGLVGIGLGSTGPIGVGVRHGWAKQGEPMLVTSSRGGSIERLDHEPALDVYLRRIGAGREHLRDGAAFRELSMRFPLGLSRRSGEDLRVVHDTDEAGGSLLCLADVPQGALAWAMGTNPEDLVAAAAQSCRDAVDGLAGQPPIGVICFDCGAREVMLGQDGIGRELAAIATTCGEVPFGGFYTYGEIARTRGARGMHHLTVVSLALA